MHYRRYQFAILFLLLTLFTTIQANGLDSVSVEFPQATRSSDNAYVINVTSASPTGTKIEELNGLKFVDNSDIAREITPLCYDYLENAEGTPINIYGHEFSIGAHKVICHVTTTGSSPTIKAVKLDIIVNPFEGTAIPTVNDISTTCPAGQHLENKKCVQDITSSPNPISQPLIFLLVAVAATAVLVLALYKKHKRKPTKTGSDIIDVR